MEMDERDGEGKYGGMMVIIYINELALGNGMIIRTLNLGVISGGALYLST